MMKKIANTLWRMYCLQYIKTLVNDKYTGVYADYVFGKWKRIHPEHLRQIVEAKL